jgi:hypothetical protein
LKLYTAGLDSFVLQVDVLYNVKQSQRGSTAQADNVHGDNMARKVRDFLCTGCRKAEDRQEENGVTTVHCRAAEKRIDAISYQEGMHFEDCHHRQNPVQSTLTPAAQLVRLARLARSMGTADNAVLSNYES